MTVNVRCISGELPDFWNRETVFFTNIQSLFYGNEELTEILKREISGVPTYGGRVIPILNLLYKGGKNLIYLESEPDKSHLNYLSGELGLRLPDIRVLDHNEYLHLTQDTSEKSVLMEVQNHQCKWIDGYVTDKVLIDIALATGKKTIASYLGSKNGNNKSLLYHHFKKLGLPTFDTISASNNHEVLKALEELRKQGYKKAVIKSQIGASGFGLVKHLLENSLQKDFPPYFFYDGPCLVQGWIDESIDGVEIIGSPSVQMFLSDKEVFLFDMTDQFLSPDSLHQGNISPPPFLEKTSSLKSELLNQATEGGKWLHTGGCKRNRCQIRRRYSRYLRSLR
ncbi:MAG: hypothetical protein HQK84_05835, partial [Nitrospinae bacterium]|nr:hypothetical protein [Nitrospinota bacterium]